MFNDRFLLGLTIPTARELVAPYGLFVLEVFETDDTKFIGLDYKPNRINVVTTHGIITSVRGRG